MNALNMKQEAIDVISKLPNTVDLEEIIYRLYALNQIHQGLDDMVQGKVTSQDELVKEVAEW